MSDTQTEKPSSQLLPENIGLNFQEAQIDKEKVVSFDLPAEDMQKNMEVWINDINRDKEKIISGIKKLLTDLGLTKVKILEKNGRPTPEERQVIFVFTSRNLLFTDPLVFFSIFRSNSYIKALVPQDNEKFENIFQQTSEAKTIDERMKYLKQMNHLVHEQVMVLPITHYKSDIFFDPTTVDRDSLQQNGRVLLLDSVR